jgi:hypothetical protein
MNDADGHEIDPAKKYLTNLTDIGHDWNLTNRDLGDLLRNGGYRCDGKPTTKALDEGLAVLRFIGDYPSYSWSRDLVAKHLERLGKERRQATVGTPKELFLVTPLVID